jgi:hypothetical protein
MKKANRPCLAIIPFVCALLSAVPLRAQDYPLAPGTRWTYHLRKEVGPLAHFEGEDARLAKNEVVDITIIAHVAGTEQISGNTYTRVEALHEDKPANTDWYALTPAGLLHPRAVDYIADSQSEFDPPEVLLSPTLRPGESWTWQDRKGLVTSKKTASAPEQITVPAGSYRATPVHTELIIPTDLAPLNVMMTQWFVPGVGFIKQEVRFEMKGNLLMHNTMTLEKFEQAATPK